MLAKIMYQRKWHGVSANERKRENNMASINNSYRSVWLEENNGNNKWRSASIKIINGNNERKSKIWQ